MKNEARSRHSDGRNASAVARNVFRFNAPGDRQMQRGNNSGLKQAEWFERQAKSAIGLAQSKTWWIVAPLLLLAAVAVSARAQPFSIDWFTIDGGGGTSSGGVYSASGTIGQADANPRAMTGGNFSLIGGFWALLPVQTPGAPLLTRTARWFSGARPRPASHCSKTPTSTPRTGQPRLKPLPTMAPTNSLS